MNTANTTGASGEIKRFDPETQDAGRGMFYAGMTCYPEGAYVLHSDHLAALARARKEARREALEEAAQAALLTGRMVTDGLVRFGRYEEGYSRARADVVDTILALPPTPQGETKEKS